MYPILFKFGPIEIHTGAVLLAIGLMAAIIKLLHTVRFQRLNINILSEHFFALLFFSLASARLTFVFTNFSYYTYLHPNHRIFGFFMLWDGEISFWGGLFGCLATIICLSAHQKENIWKWLDACTFPMLLIILFLKLGYFFEGLDYGTASTLPWSVIFENNVYVKYTIPIHPTQIYSALFALAVFLFLRYFPPLSISDKNPGTIFLSALILFSFYSLLESFIRGDDILQIGMIRIDQLFSFIILLIGATLWKKKMNFSSKT